MTLLKAILFRAARLLRLMSKAVKNWPWVLVIACVISPVSLHVTLPYQLSYSDCAYIGTRGVIRPDALGCPLIAVIDTRSGEIVSW